MNIQPETLQSLRNRFRLGVRVQLVQMNDPYTKLKPGDEGAVSFIDDTGTIFVDWDSGSTLGIVYGEDRCELIEEASHD